MITVTSAPPARVPEHEVTTRGTRPRGVASAWRRAATAPRPLRATSSPAVSPARATGSGSLVAQRPTISGRHLGVELDRERRPGTERLRPDLGLREQRRPGWQRERVAVELEPRPRLDLAVPDRDDVEPADLRAWRRCRRAARARSRAAGPRSRSRAPACRARPRRRAGHARARRASRTSSAYTDHSEPSTTTRSTPAVGSSGHASAASSRRKQGQAMPEPERLADQARIGVVAVREHERGRHGPQATAPLRWTVP